RGRFGMGGGGGTGFRPGGFQSSQSDRRGPDFFEPRVMDDPQPTLFDPQLEPALSRDVQPFVTPTLRASDSGDIRQVAWQEKPPPAGGKDGEKSGDLNAPRLGVNIEALESLGGVIIRTNSAAAMEAVFRRIHFIQKESAGADIQIHLVPLQFMDATSLTGTLNQLFSRVAIYPNSNVLLAPRVQQGVPQQQPPPQQQQQLPPGAV